jgi:RNA polymerase sigma-70 factor (ECF subfamily)
MHMLNRSPDETASAPRTPSIEFVSAAVEHYGRPLHRFLARRLHRPEEIEDLVQETYLALLKIPYARLIANPRAYVLRVAANVLWRFSKRDRFRQRYVEVDSELVDFTAENPSCPSADALAERVSSQEQLNAALSKLPAVFQAVLLMHYSYGYSYEEISRKLGISGHQVERYIARAKQALMAVDWGWD